MFVVEASPSTASHQDISQSLKLISIFLIFFLLIKGEREIGHVLVNVIIMLNTTLLHVMKNVLNHIMCLVKCDSFFLARDKDIAWPVHKRHVLTNI